MKETEFYQRAISDEGFRHQQLDDLRYLKTVSSGTVWFAGVLVVGQIMWRGFSAGAWTSGFDSLGFIFFMGLSHALVASRLNALEAIDRAALSRSP